MSFSSLDLGLGDLPEGDLPEGDLWPEGDLPEYDFFDKSPPRLSANNVFPLHNQPCCVSEEGITVPDLPCVNPGVFGIDGTLLDNNNLFTLCTEMVSQYVKSPVLFDRPHRCREWWHIRSRQGRVKSEPKKPVSERVKPVSERVKPVFKPVSGRVKFVFKPKKPEKPEKPISKSKRRRLGAN